MIRAVAFASLLVLAAPTAWAQETDGGSPAPSAVTPAPAPAPTPAPAPAPAAAAPTSGTDLEAFKRDLLEQARKAADERVAQAKDEMRNEVRAELATQSANRSWEEEWQEQKKKLELLELNGYLRARPTLLHNMDLSRGPDPEGNFLQPRPVVDPDQTKARSQAWADMRFRLEPTFNISEDIRVRAQIDMLDNLVMGSTPEVDPYYPTAFFSQNQLAPQAGVNGVLDSIRVKRAYAEVNTPVGLLSFGRMGSNWGMGMLTNDGNCLDCDYGDTVDRIQFAAKIAGFYIVPMLDFVGKGPTTASDMASLGYVGQPIDLDQAGNVAGPVAGPVVTVAVAKRDTDKEIQRKLDGGEYSLNYGVYFSYRRQAFDLQLSADGKSYDAINRGASAYTPDLWFRFVNKKFKLEAELAGVFGSINDRALTAAAAADPTQNQSLTMTQFGGVVRGSTQLLDGQLHILGEVGFASGDSAPGLGNRDIMGNKATQAGDVDGPQFNCSTLNCADGSINNFRFNRDFRIDQILWRQILGSVTDAFYIKPGVRYDIADGFGVFLNVVYSRTLFAASAPGGDSNLGVEFNPGVEYRSDDGFNASVVYGGLIPLKGLSNPPNAFHSTAIDAGVAHAVRAMFAVKF